MPEPNLRSLAYSTVRALEPAAYAMAAVNCDYGDLVSEAMLAGCYALDSYQEGHHKALDSWIIKKMRYAVQERLTYARRLKYPILCINTEDLDAFASHEESVEETIERRALRRWVRGHVARLESRRRRIIVLHFWGDMTHEKIAEHMRISESRVYQLYRDALVRLETQMEYETVQQYLWR